MQPAPPGASSCPSCSGVLEETFRGGGGCMFSLLQAGIGTEEEVAKDSTQDALEGSVRFGVYEIDCHADGSLCELGRGAMGLTYRATDTSLQRKVALKIIKTDIAERSADARERCFGSIPCLISCAVNRDFKSSARKSNTESRALFRGSPFASLRAFRLVGPRLRCLLRSE